MKTKYVLLASALIAASGYATMAAAATDTTSFDATITIQDSCDANVATVNDLNFGTRTFADTNISSTTDISVKCTTDASYTIGLTAASGGTGSRTMSGPGTSIGYEMYSNAGHTSVWGDTIGTDTVADTGNGTSQTHTVYGLVSSIPGTASAGNYSDTVTVTVTY
ncbi:MAG: spore coat protein U domain-containing protein [Rhodanobacteraceae bacterium]